MTPRRAAPAQSAPDPIRCDGVGFAYKGSSNVLNDVSVTLTAGSFHFLTGLSGAGKSTLLNLFSLNSRPTTGRITLFGEDVTTLDRRSVPLMRRRIGLVFQDFRLVDHLSVYDNVALPLRLAAPRDKSWGADVHEMLAWVGLADRMHQPVETLSGGERQRVAIARAVIGRPDLILADEPTGNVDAAMAERLLGLFQALNRLGVTILIASHDEALADRSGARRLHLAEGRLA